MLNKIEALIHAWHYVITDNYLHIVKADEKYSSEKYRLIECSAIESYITGVNTYIW